MTVLSADISDNKDYIPHSCLSYPFICIVFYIIFDIKFLIEKVNVEKVLSKWMLLFLLNKKISRMAGEMTPWLKALAVLLEDPGSIPSTHNCHTGIRVGKIPMHIK